MKKHFPRIGLVVKQSDPEVRTIASEIIRFLSPRCNSLVIQKKDLPILDQETTFYIESVTSKHDFCDGTDLVIAIGGDGTFLGAARLCAWKNIPIAGINLGRIGFLASITPEQACESLSKILERNFLLEERIVIHSTHVRNKKPRHSISCNEVAIRDREIRSIRLMDITVKIDDNFVRTVRADGIIISTPTGSTAYALSCGGPLIEPTQESLLIVPICPHTFSNRPLVVPSDKKIELTLTSYSGTKTALVCDGQRGRSFLLGDALILTAYKNKLRLIQPHSYDYYATLRNKLKWGKEL